MEGDVLRMSEHVDFGDLFTVEQFLADVKCGALIDYDGFNLFRISFEISRIFNFPHLALAVQVYKVYI